jgi:hypothetical protein
VAYTFADESTEESLDADAEADAAAAEDYAAGPAASLGWAPAGAPDAGAADYSYAAGPSASNDTSTSESASESATAGKKPIHVAGILSGTALAETAQNVFSRFLNLRFLSQFPSCDV